MDTPGMAQRAGWASTALPMPEGLTAQRPPPGCPYTGAMASGPAVHMQCVDYTSGTPTLSSSWSKKTQRLTLAREPGHASAAQAHTEAGVRLDALQAGQELWSAHTLGPTQEGLDALKATPCSCPHDPVAAG